MLMKHEFDCTARRLTSGFLPRSAKWSIFTRRHAKGAWCKALWMGKTAVIRVMAAHPHIRPYALDLSDGENQSSQLVALFEQASRNTPALVILEDLDRAFPTEGKRTRERSVSFQTLLNCL